VRKHGWRGGVVAALGIAVGIWVHILAAAAGLSALLMASARAFMFAKLVGAAYLLFLATVHQFWHRVEGNFFFVSRACIRRGWHIVEFSCSANRRSCW
jgi:hypothetical protein